MQLAPVWSEMDQIAPMPHHATAEVVDAIAAELEAELGCSLPLPPREFCSLIGWETIRPERAHEQPHYIAHDGDEGMLAATVAARVVTLTGCSATPALVDATALRLCGSFFLADGSAAARTGRIKSALHALRKCSPSVRDRFDAA